MTQKKICIGIRAHDCRLYMTTGFSALLGSFLDCLSRGWGVTFCILEGHSVPAVACNIIVARFLRDKSYADCTDLVFVDNDVSWADGDLGRLCAHDVDVIGAPYRFKNHGGHFALQLYPERDLDPVVLPTGELYEVKGVPPGFMRITRNALEQMVKEYDYLRFVEGAAPNNTAWMLFENSWRPHGIWDEGYIFCEKWRGLGGKVYIDPFASTCHTGPQQFIGSFAGWMEDNRNKQKMAALASSSATDEQKSAALEVLTRSLNELARMPPRQPIDATPIMELAKQIEGLGRAA